MLSPDDQKPRPRDPAWASQVLDFEVTGGKTVKYGLATIATLLIFCATLNGQLPPETQSQGASIPSPKPEVVLHQIDLEPTGTMFSYDKPVLEGDTYVFHALPEKTIERLPKARVKKITQRTRDFDKEVVFLVDLSPSGNVLASDEPVLKGKLYHLHAWKGGTLMTVRQADVKKITRLTGMDAFIAKEKELGSVALQGNVQLKSGVSGGAAPGPAAAPAGGAAPPAGNWTYEGVPGQTDAYAPGNATVARPGDVPKAPAPTNPPR
jgi:hypothetical protein